MGFHYYLTCNLDHEGFSVSIYCWILLAFSQIRVCPRIPEISRPPFHTTHTHSFSSSSLQQFWCQRPKCEQHSTKLKYSLFSLFDVAVSVTPIFYEAVVIRPLPSDGFVLPQLASFESFSKDVLLWKRVYEMSVMCTENDLAWHQLWK